MERKLASIQRIKALDPIPNADAIEKATVLGWELVVKRGEFNVGDLCVYFEVDSILPERPEFEFLRARHFRIKTIKLKGQVSQGIAFPLSILPIPAKHPSESIPGTIHDCALRLDYKEGDDVTELLGVTKWELYVPAQLRGQIKGNFPSFLIKTDETRIQAVPSVLERHKGLICYVTEKIDGTSFTAFLNNGEFGICSRNLELKDDDTVYWKTAKELDLEARLRAVNGDFSVQGELIGQGIQKNKYGLSNVLLKVFNVFDIANRKYLDFNAFTQFVSTLGLETVPVLETNHVLLETIPDLVALADRPSLLNKAVPREGIIIRPLQEMRDEDLGRLSFKVINPRFLLKFEE